MVSHVERHLRQLSLAALTANAEDDNDNDDSENSDASSSPVHGDPVSQDDGDKHKSGGTELLKSHPLYTGAVQGEDGLWHCPWEGEGYCNHKATVLEAEFKYVPAPSGFVPHLFRPWPP